MKTLTTMLFLSIGLISAAQNDSSYISTTVENEIYTIDFASAKNKIAAFVFKNNIVIQSQTESKKDVRVKFVLDQQQYKRYDSLVKSLGYSSSKQVNTVNNYVKVKEINLELSYLKEKRASYVELINKVDDYKSPNYFTLWNEQKVVEEKIFNKERELVNLNKKENYYYVHLDLNDETTSPENTGVSFVNMPGIEYSYLKIESPKTGISAQNYQGYFIKYLFTKGKSFATIGVYKNNQIEKRDTAAYSELFVMGFGQDFYSRYAGRGSRKYFNLYSGYTVGGIFATGTTSKANMFYLAPSIGLELFKNRYFLIDTKVSYFTPLTDNRNLRGLNCSASFNFVF
jgi:hypothetical protein